MRYPILVALLLLVRPSPVSALVPDVVSAHSVAVDSIQCLTCDVVVDDLYHDSKRQKQLRGRYSRFGDRVRVTTSHSDGRDVHIDLEDRTLVLFLRTGTRGESLHSAALTHRAHKRSTHCDAWAAAMFRLSVPNTSDYCALAAVIAKAKSVKYHEAKEDVSGVACRKVSLLFPNDPEVCIDNWTLDIWLSESHGWMVKKCVYETTLRGGHRQVRTDEVERFTQLPNGRWFPSLIVYRATIGGLPDMTRSVSLADIRTPDSLPDDTFRIRYPNPTPMTDHIRQTTYTVDETGRRTGPEAPLSPVALPPVKGTDTEVEPVNWWSRIVLVTSLILLFYAACVVVRRRLLLNR